MGQKLKITIAFDKNMPVLVAKIPSSGMTTIGKGMELLMSPTMTLEVFLDLSLRPECDLLRSLGLPKGMELLMSPKMTLEVFLDLSLRPYLDL